MRGCGAGGEGEEWRVDSLSRSGRCPKGRSGPTASPETQAGRGPEAAPGTDGPCRPNRNERPPDVCGPDGIRRPNPARTPASEEGRVSLSTDDGWPRGGDARRAPRGTSPPPTGAGRNGRKRWRPNPSAGRAAADDKMRSGGIQGSDVTGEHPCSPATPSRRHERAALPLSARPATPQDRARKPRRAGAANFPGSSGAGGKSCSALPPRPLPPLGDRPSSAATAAARLSPKRRTRGGRPGAASLAAARSSSAHRGPQPRARGSEAGGEEGPDGGDEGAS